MRYSDKASAANNAAYDEAIRGLDLETRRALDSVLLGGLFGHIEPKHFARALSFAESIAVR